MTDSFPPDRQRFVGHYEIETVLGRGAVGTVYLARDRRIGRMVALKIIDLENARFEDESEAHEFVQRLQREVEIGGRLNHINLVTLYDVAYVNERISHIAMELVDGPSLADLIKERRPDPMPVQKILEIARHVLRGLSHAHGQGVVHRDIKPANILLTKGGVVKIADFGIARPDESSLTVSGTLMGTPNYMSPEQVRGEAATPQSDLFSLGAVLYEMSTGRKPFAATDLSGVLYKVVGQPHPPIESPSIPVRLKTLVDRLLEKAPEDRPASADEVLAAIEDIETGIDTAAEITSVSTGLPGDATSPGNDEGIEDLELKKLSGLALRERAVPASTFWLVIAIWFGVLLAVALSIAVRIDPSPTVTIPEETLREFAAKREALDRAGQLCENGQFDECVAAYDAYLENYPHARAATTARDEAVRLRTEIRAGADAQESRSAWKRFTTKVKGLFGKD